jgi:hypothetical protein
VRITSQWVDDGDTAELNFVSGVSVSVVVAGRPGGRGFQTWPCVGARGQK